MRVLKNWVTAWTTDPNCRAITESVEFIDLVICSKQSKTYTKIECMIWPALSMSSDDAFDLSLSFDECVLDRAVDRNVVVAVKAFASALQVLSMPFEAA